MKSWLTAYLDQVGVDHNIVNRQVNYFSKIDQIQSAVKLVRNIHMAKKYLCLFIKSTKYVMKSESIL